MKLRDCIIKSLILAAENAYNDSMMQLPLPKISDIKNKTVLVRVDFNVPLDEDGQVADAERIQSALETILFLREHQAKIILLSHLGRPDGRRDQKYSLQGVAQYLQRQLKLPTHFVADCIGPEVQQAHQSLQAGEILVLENVRFYPEEEANDLSFAKRIIADTGAQVFINEAFSASHRAHASVVGLAKFLPHFAGFSLEIEVTMMNKIIDKVARPFVVVLGGAKIDDKVQAVSKLTQLADLVLVGGGLANAFLRASGIEIHQSFMGSDGEKNVGLARKILMEHQTERTLVPAASNQAKLPLPKIILPVDVLCAKNSKVKTPIDIKSLALLKDVRDSERDLSLQYLDIGPKTIALYTYLLSTAKTIFWNGPMGVFENELFAKGSRSIAKTIARLSTESAVTSISGGGETNAVINACGLHNRFSHVSTGGGAALEFLGGKKLPGIEALLA